MTKRLWIVAIVLVLSFGVRTWKSSAAPVPERKPLSQFPTQVGAWNSVHEEVLSEPVQGVLKADDYILRSYRAPKNRPVDLFIAYYFVQRAGESMHSPRNCLPGWGWEIVKTDQVMLNKDPQQAPIWINRFIVEKDGARAMVLYWYQSSGRVIASEYWGKIYLVWDALRSGRRDGAIVRFVVPMGKNEDPQKALDTGLDIARAAAPTIPQFIPN